MGFISKKSTVLYFMFGLVLVVFSLWFSAWTTAYLWNNIMAYLFALPRLSVLEAFALDLFMMYMFVPQTKHRGDEDVIDVYVKVIFTTLGFLIIGAIVILFL